MKLQNDGRRPVSIPDTSELLCEKSNRIQSGKEMSRWEIVKVWKTPAGTIILYCAHMTCWEGESDTRLVDAFQTTSEVVAFLEKREHPLASEVADALGVSEDVP